MSKYTTQVRFICENKSGLMESTGFSDIDNVINKSWDKIFTTTTSFFNEEYRSVLCKKILKHYYLREIGCETVGIWILWMNTKLEEIMPYYNQLYKSAEIKFNPMHDTDITRTHNRIENEKSDGKRSGNGNKRDNLNQNEIYNTNGNSEETKIDLYSDTPQGSLSGLENANYLTNARKDNDNITNSQENNTNTEQTNESNYTDSETTINNINTTEDYIENVVGKQGGTDYSDLLIKFRDTMLNIDMLVIEEFSELFMNLW